MAAHRIVYARSLHAPSPSAAGAACRLRRHGRRALLPRVWRLVVALGLAGAMAAPLAAQPATGAPLVLRPGDAIKLTVWESPSFSGEFEVATDGTLHHPLLNRVVVAGIPMDSVRGRIITFLSDYQREPAVDIKPLVRVVVLGEVRTPGVYLLPPETTVADAVVKAGSPTLNGHERRVSLERGGRQRQFDASEASLEPSLRTVQSGDRILVPRRNTRSLWSVIGPILQITAGFATAYLTTYLIIVSRRDLP
ncbi:polysaccharide biosynthesis/export family protein [Gemmatimonas sp.]|jgi:polysaccharide export outer membrane protein|uniref:polysaccharide biosynthesis/export family protein n=1 Tax=Gemmatimonas sp. TaxID=1962908 RepID=UPI0025BC6DDD|nr:polysaccharide biosynthesis/export family protein [Gemmatimonas sp.]MCA2983335.1 polysaccharide export protein [Gemmatimonas sp.]MCA2988739.1 polysaccharide export protein [Gemmatimonas sp.]MCA2994464.1 polysaccharide export protein [Gemmatimonas sp.]